MRSASVESQVSNAISGLTSTAEDLNQRLAALWSSISSVSLSTRCRAAFPRSTRWILNRVKPEREAKAAGGTRDSMQYEDNGGSSGRRETRFRLRLSGTATLHRNYRNLKALVFRFLEDIILSDNKLITIALDEASVLGVLSSRLHVAYSVRTGGWLGVGNDFRIHKTRVFRDIPIPCLLPRLKKSEYERSAERLDTSPKATAVSVPTPSQSPTCTTFLRDSAPRSRYSAKEKLTHEQGLVSVLEADPR